MVNFEKLLQKLIREEIYLDDLLPYKDQFLSFANSAISGNVTPEDPALEAFLKLCLDFYTYSISGEVLISDSMYDQCMKVYRSKGNQQIVYADSIKGTKKWDFIDHEVQGAVGSLDKIYEYPELKDYLRKNIGVNKYILAPKFDGISCAIKIHNGEIVSAATRYNGIQGQNITPLAKRAKNSKKFIKTMSEEYGNGIYKCELCVDTESFEELIGYKKYANRRSATSGIINTPSNLEYARFITIIPLLFFNPVNKKMRYLAPWKKVVQFYSPQDLMDDIESMLDSIKTKDFPFRTDGVVINPDPDSLGNPNEFDLMDRSIAFKVNTSEGKTRIKFGYMSVGRLGKGTPMIRVEPVEVNETIVKDASLGSYDKFLSMDLKENEEVIVFSAGDVIPQVKLPPMRTNFYNKPDLKIKRICPYCNEKLTRVNAEYYCTNNDCPRIITGRISNFLDKMGMEGFSDKSIEMIYDAYKIRSIKEFLNLTVGKIVEIDGFDTTSANALVNELQKIKTTPVSLAKFFGSLGIEKISEKKCRKIFEYVTVDELFGKKNLDRIYYALQTSDGIGEKTAAVFVDFIKRNRDEIIELMKELTIGNDIKYVGSIVFTGFRPDKLTEEKIRSLGVDIGNSVTKTTIAVVTATHERDSVKSKAAIAKGIPVIHASKLDDLIYEISQGDVNLGIRI